MKKTITILLFMFVLLPGCSSRNEPEQGNIKIITTRDTDLDPEVVASWGRQKEYFLEDNREIIDWPKAEEILLSEKIRGGKQYHTRWLTIYTEDDRKYLVRQPEMDALWKFMEAKGMDLQGFGTE